MEFTVSKAELVRELSLSQGVVEKKTTIPILSNVLFETDGDRVILTATDLELGIRCSCPAKVTKQGAGTIPARQAARLRTAAARFGHSVEVRRQPVGESALRPFADSHGRYVARKLSGTAADAGNAGGDSDQHAGRDGAEDDLRDLGGRIPIHAERRAAASEERRADDGRDGWSPAGSGGVRSTACRRLERRIKALLPRKAMQETREALRRCRREARCFVSPAMTIICSSRSASGC